LTAVACIDRDDMTFRQKLIIIAYAQQWLSIHSHVTLQRKASAVRDVSIAEREQVGERTVKWRAAAVE
jgi:hypothetical protein